MSIANPACVFVALGIQHAMHMRHIVICGLPRSTVFIHIISQTARFSKKKVIEHKMCVASFSTISSEIFFILRKTERHLIKNVYWSSCKVPFIFA